MAGEDNMNGTSARWFVTEGRAGVHREVSLTARIDCIAETINSAQLS